MIDLAQQVQQALSSEIENFVSSTAEQLQKLAKYECSIANMELAGRTILHGHDFKTIPENVINSIQVRTVKDKDKVSIEMSIPNEVLTDMSDSLVEYFNDYILENTEKRITASIGG